MTAVLDEATEVPARMANPFDVIPEVRDAVFGIARATQACGLSPMTSRLAQLRAAQINGCAFCVGRKTAELIDGEEPEGRIAAVSTWRQATCFTDAERAALALAEVLTRLPEQSAGALDGALSAASRHLDERALAALIVDIGLVNLASRVFVAIRQPACVIPPAVGAH